MKTRFITLMLLLPSLSIAAQNAQFVKPYLVIQTLLAKDTFKGVSEEAKKLTEALKADRLPEDSLLAEALQSSKDIETARTAFEKLNAKLVPWIKKHPQSGTELAYCPMKKASWLQKKGDIQNPYYGAEMLECGVKEDER